MELINKILENDIIFYSIIVGLLFIFLLIIYFVFIYKKKENNNISNIKEEEKEKITKDDNIDNEIVSVLEKMSEDIKDKQSESLDDFEKEQEENAIISYQELVNKVKSEKIDISLEDIYEEKEVNDTKDDKNEEIKDYNKIDNESVTDFNSLIESDIDDLPKEEVKKYKRSEIISPIYGRQDIDVNYPKIKQFDKNKNFKDSLLEIEDALKNEPLTDEDRINEDFLNTLREFRKKL